MLGVPENVIYVDMVPVLVVGVPAVKLEIDRPSPPARPRGPGLNDSLV